MKQTTNGYKEVAKKKTHSNIIYWIFIASVIIPIILALGELSLNSGDPWAGIWLAGLIVYFFAISIIATVLTAVIFIITKICHKVMSDEFFIKTYMIVFLIMFAMALFFYFILPLFPSSY